MPMTRGMATLFGVALMFAVACGTGPTQPTSVGAPANAFTAPGAVEGMAALSTAALTAADLSARGWSCRPIPGGTGCVPPNQVVPSAALPPEDRPAVVV